MTLMVRNVGARNSTPAKSGRAYRKPRSTRKSQGMTKQDVIKLIDNGREIKRLWGKIQTDNIDNYVEAPTGTLVPKFVFSDGNNQYESYCLNATRQGLENENRIGNVIKPQRFTLKGYGVLATTFSGNTIQNTAHVRLVVGFRRQSSILTPANGNLMLEGGVEVPLNFDYTDTQNGFNWKEFRPFYDKEFLIAPQTRDSNVPITNPFIKNYFHFNIDHKFSPTAENLVTFENDVGDTNLLYNNNNIYAMFIVRQMNNDNDIVLNLPIEIYATSLFQFTDA